MASPCLEINQAGACSFLEVLSILSITIWGGFDSFDKLERKNS